MSEFAMQPAPPRSTRRKFYMTLIYGIHTIIGLMLAIPAIAYLFFPPRTKKAAQWVDAADLAQIPVNSPQEVSFTVNRIDGWKVNSVKTTAWVVKTADDRAVAFAPQCTHLGCAYHWDEVNKDFLCPCHTSTFAIDGRVTSGPAPRPLERYAVKIEGTKLLLGPIQRNA